jgi:hypothetical protein
VIVIGVDPGYEQSALVAWDGCKILHHTHEDNAGILDHLRANPIDPHAPCARMLRVSGAVLVIEMVESFGMAVGRTVFETVFQSGRFAEAWMPRRVERIPRREIKLHLCGHARATDSNIRQALIDRFGPSTEKAIGKKKTPGPLYGITAHKLSALAVALTWADQHQAVVDGQEIRPGIIAEF